MDFTPADRESITWLKVKDHYTAKLESLRRRNDGKMSEADRNFLIGQIFEITALLSLEKPKVTIKE